MEELLPYLLIVLVCLGGSFVQRVSGFGFGIFVMLFFPYLLASSPAAAAVSSILSGIISLYNAIRQRKHLQIKLVIPMLCAAMITIPLAISLSKYAPETVMKPLLGIVLILLSIYFLFFSTRIHIRPTAANSFAAGALSGTLGGLFSTGGPPAVLFLLHATNDKVVYFATIQTYFGLTNTYSTVVRIINGIITREILTSVMIGLIGCLIGNRIGSWAFDKLDGEKLKKVIYAGMIVSGILMIA